ncbi:MAG: hypothetical protein MZV64_48490 [Ignavibacteriales bacterium]|nr:hypothetical protein [Ignavibacteriales bacterium]
MTEIDANLAFIRGNIKQNREQLSKETDSGKRARLEYEIMNGETEALAEEDMKKSILTGQNITPPLLLTILRGVSLLKTYGLSRCGWKSFSAVLPVCKG